MFSQNNLEVEWNQIWKQTESFIENVAAVTGRSIIFINTDSQSSKSLKSIKHQKEYTTVLKLLYSGLDEDWNSLQSEIVSRKGAGIIDLEDTDWMAQQK